MDIVAPNMEARQLNIDFWILGGRHPLCLLLGWSLLGVDAAREFPSDSVVGLVGTVFCSF